MRKKLQNSKDYADSPEFLPALGLKNKSIATTGGKLDRMVLYTHTLYIYNIWTDPITLPCSLVCATNNDTWQSLL